MTQLRDKQAILKQRARILNLIRHTLDDRGYVEVETPQRVRSPGTDVHLEAFASEDRYLITSPEFHMKRLIASGFERIYQICHCFRKGERTRLHNPEFAMLEFYAAGMDFEGMMAETESLIWEVANTFGKNSVTYDGITCELSLPWERLSVYDAFLNHAGWSPRENFDEDRFYYDLVDKVERHLGRDRPTILYHYPAPLAMLAVIDPDNPAVAKRFEVYISGVEIANAFEELTDANEQRRRFETDLEIRGAASKPSYPIDETFLTSLDTLPDCNGIAVGLDRLIMLLTGAQHIDQVIAFPESDV